MHPSATLDLQANLERTSRAKEAAEARALEVESALRAAERLLAGLQQAGSSTDAIKWVTHACMASSDGKRRKRPMLASSCPIAPLIVPMRPALSPISVFPAPVCMPSPHSSCASAPGCVVAHTGAVLRCPTRLPGGWGGVGCRGVLEERIRSLEDALATRERGVAQMRDSMLQADLEYKKVCVLPGRPGVRGWLHLLNAALRHCLSGAVRTCPAPPPPCKLSS